MVDKSDDSMIADRANALEAPDPTHRTVSISERGSSRRESAGRMGAWRCIIGEMISGICWCSRVVLQSAARGKAVAALQGSPTGGSLDKIRGQRTRATHAKH